MKHLHTFENFTEQEKDQYIQITDVKDELETSDAFSEMPENEQEVLSNAYSKESETISNELCERVRPKYRIRNFNREVNLDSLKEIL